MKQFIGKNRAGNLDWLANVWLKDGPPVCFLQGFPGVGKTDLARDFRELAENAGWKPAVINEVADRATPNVVENLMELSIILSQQGLPEMERVLFEQSNPNLAYAIERVLQRPVVIILDEAQRFFRAASGTPLPEMNGILAFLRNRQDLRGRLLLITDRIAEEARWSEWIPKRTLTALEPDEAVAALNTKLKEAGLEVQMSTQRMQEVVRDLAFNPRAIEALVGALRYDTLDDIIERNPGLWAVRDREVSREFLKALERDLLERTMRYLDGVHQRKLWRLAVHRRSFKQEALEKLSANKDESAELRSILVTRFLLNFYKGSFSLNPIVREISLSHLKEDVADYRQAHSTAADYHMRHFKAKQIVGTQAKLGESFAELRYHLVQAGRADELTEIGQRFTSHLKQEIKSVSPVPTDAGELEERIAVLTVLLGSGGAKGLEYHLARCLQARNKTEDIHQAIIHAKRAIDREIVDSWVLCAELLATAGKTDEAVALLKEGITVIPPEKSLQPLYQACAELLATTGKTDEAVALLKEGITVIPPEKNLFALYQSCAELLAAAGKTDEAVALLKEGITVIPPMYAVHALYKLCAELLAGDGKQDEANALLEDGARRVPDRMTPRPDKGLRGLIEHISTTQPGSLMHAPPPAASSAPVESAPKVYVSYAWGEDSSEAGRQREEIVDRLCEAVQRTGRQIGRDKDRMRGGDSIERFAHQISKAQRIVAIVSEKSLHSEFCMAHELFRAFRRCDYQRAEFQEKVIAVVMDDARPLLKDNLALLALARTWQERMEKLRSELKAVDGTRKSPALWVFVDMMEDMCPRLPDMLGALQDIVMKRGFDEVVADNFKEVISRLPSP